MHGPGALTLGQLVIEDVDELPGLVDRDERALTTRIGHKHQIASTNQHPIAWALL